MNPLNTLYKKLLAFGLLLGLLNACNLTVENDHNKEETVEAMTKKTKPADSAFTLINTDEALIATALMAAPAEKRSDCKVIGYNMKGEFVTLKEGTNELICLADDPAGEGFSAACYHKSLEPFMARGRELKDVGHSYEEIFEIREKEAETGKLEMAHEGATLAVYYAPKAHYNAETGEVPEANYRYVVYMPWATAESTGLPEKPHAGNHPWIMNPGTHRAHIMITPKQ